MAEDSSVKDSENTNPDIDDSGNIDLGNLNNTIDDNSTESDSDSIRPAKLNIKEEKHSRKRRISEGTHADCGNAKVSRLENYQEEAQCGNDTVTPLSEGADTNTAHLSAEENEANLNQGENSECFEDGNSGTLYPNQMADPKIMWKQFRFEMNFSSQVNIAKVIVCTCLESFFLTYIHTNHQRHCYCQTENIEIFVAAMVLMVGVHETRLIEQPHLRVQ